MAAFLSAGGEGSDGPEFFHKRHVCIDNLLCVVRDRRFRSIEFAFVSITVFLFFFVNFSVVFSCHVFLYVFFSVYRCPLPISFVSFNFQLLSNFFTMVIPFSFFFNNYYPLKWISKEHASSFYCSFDTNFRVFFFFHFSSALRNHG